MKKALKIAGIIFAVSIVISLFLPKPTAKEIRQQQIVDSISAAPKKIADDSAKISEEYHKMKIDAMIESKYFCKQRLKSPSTAKFGDFDLDGCGAITDNDTDINGVYTDISHKPGVPIQNITIYRVVNYVDAQNSFGTIIRNWYRIELSYNKQKNEWSLLKFYLGETLN